MYGVIFQIEALHISENVLYPQFSFCIPRALTKFCFLPIVLNQKDSCIGRHHP